MQRISPIVPRVQLLGFWTASILRVAKSGSGVSDILFDISQGC